MSTPHIVVIGSGFAALTAVRALRKRDTRVRITLVAPRAELVYYPSLIGVPAGLRQGRHLHVDPSGFLARLRVQFHAGRVTGRADGGRTVLTDTGTLANDALLIASGGRFLKSLPGIEHALTICEGARGRVDSRTPGGPGWRHDRLRVCRPSIRAGCHARWPDVRAAVRHRHPAAQAGAPRQIQTGVFQPGEGTRKTAWRKCCRGPAARNADTRDRNPDRSQTHVYRDEKRAIILPPCRLLHWAKRIFEWLYLRPYPKAGAA